MSLTVVPVLVTGTKWSLQWYEYWSQSGKTASVDNFVANRQEKFNFGAIFELEDYPVHYVQFSAEGLLNCSKCHEMIKVILGESLSR